MRNFTWNRFPIKNLLIDSLLTPIVESTYLNRDMCTFESSQKDKSRWQSTDSSKAYRNTSAFKCAFYHSGFLTNLCLPWKQSLPWNFSRQDATRTQQLYYKFPMWCFFLTDGLRWELGRVFNSCNGETCCSSRESLDGSRQTDWAWKSVDYLCPSWQSKLPVRLEFLLVNKAHVAFRRFSYVSTAPVIEFTSHTALWRRQ